MTFPTTPLLTNFTGGDQDPLFEGDTWLGPTQNGEGALRRVSNEAGAGLVINTPYQRYWVVDEYGPDTEVFTTVTVIPGAGHGVVVHLRIQSPGVVGTTRFYAGVWTNGTGWRIFRCLNGTVFTQLGSTAASPDLANGEKMGFEARGGTLTLKHFTGGDWVDRVSAFDSSITGQGFIGLQIDTSTTARFDDFGGGTAASLVDVLNVRAGTGAVW